MDLLKKTDYGVKNKDIENKMPSTTGLATIAALTAVKIKILKVSHLVTKPDYEEKIKDIEGKYFTTSDYSKWTNDILIAKIKNKELVI